MRARSVAPVALVAMLAMLLAVACGTSGHGHSLLGDTSPIGGVAPVDATSTLAPATTDAPVTAPPTSAPIPTTAVPRPPRPYAVGTTSLDLTDTTRTADGHPGRHLPTLVFYPTSGAAGPNEAGGAPGLFRGWPLVVFAHGYNVTPLTYHDLIHHLAEAGFVVAAPAFPLETRGGPLDENDLSNEPADISFVIGQTIAASGRAGPLAGMIDGSRIGVVGHSDGAEAALGVAFLPHRSDNRIGPVVSMAAQAILNGDQVMSAPTSHPLLVVQGTADTINPPERSDHVYATAPQPKAYLHLLGAGHLPPVADPNVWRPIVETAVVDWLDEWFGGPNAGGAPARLAHDGNVSGVAQVTSG